MKITANELANYIANQLKAGKEATRLAKQIAEYLVEERRTRELGMIMRKVTTIREREHGIVEATVTSAHPLSVSTKAHIKSLIGDKVVINDIHDEAVIGGVKVETAEKGIDLTVQDQLKQLKRYTGANV